MRKQNPYTDPRLSTKESSENGNGRQYIELIGGKPMHVFFPYMIK